MVVQAIEVDAIRLRIFPSTSSASVAMSIPAATRATLGEAMISIEEGRLDEVERVAREAVALFRKQKSQVDLACASTLLGDALLRERRSPEARTAAVEARRAARESHSWGAEFEACVLEARVTAALGDPSSALKGLGPVLEDARRHGCLPCELEARLALGEVEIRAGRAAAGRARLEALEKDAKAKGFLLIARKAAATARG